MSIIKKYITPKMLENIEKDITTKISECIEIQADIRKLHPDYDDDRKLSEKNRKVLREVYVLHTIIQEFKHKPDDFLFLPNMMSIVAFQEDYKVPLNEHQTEYINNFISNSVG